MLIGKQAEPIPFSLCSRPEAFVESVTALWSFCHGHVRRFILKKSLARYFFKYH